MFEYLSVRCDVNANQANAQVMKYTRQNGTKRNNIGFIIILKTKCINGIAYNNNDTEELMEKRTCITTLDGNTYV